MPHPEGYRKALRLMKQAENLIVSHYFIDTPGAYPGPERKSVGRSCNCRVFTNMSSLKVQLFQSLLEKVEVVEH